MEFGDTAYWYPGVPVEYQDYLQVDGHRVKVLTIDSLISFYERGLKNLQGDKVKQQKYNDLKVKYNALMAYNARSQEPPG